MSQNHLFVVRTPSSQHLSVRSDVVFCMPARCPGLMSGQLTGLSANREPLAEKSQRRFRSVYLESYASLNKSPRSGEGGFRIGQALHLCAFSHTGSLLWGWNSRVAEPHGMGGRWNRKRWRQTKATGPPGLTPHPRSLYIPRICWAKDAGGVITTKRPTRCLIFIRGFRPQHY